MSVAEFIAIAVTLVAALCLMFYMIEHVSKRFDQHHGVPPKQPNEDDQEFMSWLEQKMNHLED